MFSAQTTSELSSHWDTVFLYMPTYISLLKNSDDLLATLHLSIDFCTYTAPTWESGSTKLSGRVAQSSPQSYSGQGNLQNSCGVQIK